MMRKIASASAALALLTSFSAARAQNGPDNDANTAPGFTRSVFHGAQIDSINLYNGQLTIPIPLGPSYPIGPKLRMQLVLTYNSRVDDYGSPSTQYPDFYVRPLVGDPSLPIGWTLTLGAIKPCKHGTIAGVCYFSPDGSQHQFDLGAKTGDASPLYLQGSGPYDMWDGEGNHYVFGWHVSGFDDAGSYTHDFGRGRDGWYLTSLTDPHGNSYSVRYYQNVPTPLWTGGADGCFGLYTMRNPAVAKTWILKDVVLPSGNTVHVDTGIVNGVSGMITSVRFPVLAEGAAATKTWSLVYNNSYPAYSHYCGIGHTNPVNLQTLSELRLPSELAGSPSYRFGTGALVSEITLPTGGTVSYCYALYTFYHASSGSIQPGCPGLFPDSSDAQIMRTASCPGSLPEEPPRIPGGCTPDNSARWTQVEKGVVRRRETVGSMQNDTTYAQYAFPFGESGTSALPQPAQTLTVVVSPPTDRNGDAGRRRAKGVLFNSATTASTSPGPQPSSIPGDRVGAELEERVFESDPTASSWPDPPCSGNPGTDALFCGSRAVRVTRKTYEYDTAGVPGGNRRLQHQTTIYGASTCASCPRHEVDFGPPDTWESNGRHYGVETHSGTLGGDARTITTDWTPAHWSLGPPAGGAVFPNLFDRRIVAQGSSTRDESFEFDPGSGFLKGSFVYDGARDTALVHCQYDDGAGNVGREFTKTIHAAALPPSNWCSATHPQFPPSVGTDGDLFGKESTWQHGELLTTRWIAGSVSAPTFRTRDLTRDGTTGWITSSRDASGRQTAYTYDSLGRVDRIDPPAPGELETRVCYEGPNATSAYRAAAALACPVSPVSAGVVTWEHYDYDGLGRTIRERRRRPSSNVAKRFTLFDGAGNETFSSEWVPDATSESVIQDLATACVFSDGTWHGRARPSSALGTYRLCFDPFGRPQQIVGSKMSSLAQVDRSDSLASYSDTREAVTTYCVNGTFVNLQAATCSSGGFNSTRTNRKDAFGRLTSVAEPTGETTTYTYDVNGKLASVAQGAQTRSFAFDAAGILHAETTPEAGTILYDTTGSLGNVLQETRPGGLVLTRRFDFAGRLTEEDAGGDPYLVQCYDGAATCADGSAGSSGGAYPAGRLTRRYGFNFLPTPGPLVDEQFEYSDAGGRLSKRVVSVGNGDFAASTAQTWSYGNLGLPQQHGHPRTSGAFTETLAYDAGLPSSIAAGGTTVVPAAGYDPSGGLASWKAGNLGTPVVTTIAQDPSMLPRPASISNALWSSGTYRYDGADNILAIGGDAFTYDARSRLLTAKYGTTTRPYGYDRYGNLTRNVSAIAIDPGSNRVTSASYDARGNMIAYNGESLRYDALDRQYRDVGPGADWVYLYDGAGERVAKFPTRFTVLRREMARLVAEANIIAKNWTLPGCSVTFADVPCSDPDARYIQLIHDESVTAGCGGNPPRYCPDSTLTRAQMAVFLVKGYKPGGFQPPGCQGIFQDVTCSGAYAPYAPWIEQLYRDGVTAGCSASPLRFCPGNTVGEWEMLVWLSKAPGTAPGTAFWAAYDPVPRGTIYTFRDDQNRIVTEMSGGSSGAGSATLSVARDNVFLGNLLVASYVASPAGWQYTTSDHLGSPRIVFNQSGQLVETHKHWPYGEDTVTGVPGQRLAYCLMERDTEAKHYYDHARTHDYALGRFLSPDQVGGRPADPQSWNRYAYTLGNPMKHVDPDGRLTIVIPGTGNKGTRDFLPGGRFFQHVVRTVPDRAYASLQWSGADNHRARLAGANALINFVDNYKFAAGEKLNIVGFSHGGNLGILSINLGLPKVVDNLVTLGPPSRAGYRLLDPNTVGRFVNVFNANDQVQIRGGGDFESPFEFGAAARTQPFALNLSFNVDAGPIGSHSILHTPEALDFVLPHMDLDSQDRTRTPRVYVIR
jgi:RHS repeat-associated protein